MMESFYSFYAKWATRMKYVQIKQIIALITDDRSPMTTIRIKLADPKNLSVTFSIFQLLLGLELRQWPHTAYYYFQIQWGKLQLTQKQTEREWEIARKEVLAIFRIVCFLSAPIIPIVAATNTLRLIH